MTPLAPPPDAAAPALDRAAHLEILNEIARIATLDLELRPMLQRITNALASRFGWEFVACVSVDPLRQTFVCEALTTALPTEVYPGYGRALGSGVVGEVALTGKPILLDDVSAYPNYVDTLPGARSELCIPVRHRGELVAVLNLESLTPAAFHDQLPLLETVAEQVAGAIASARLHRETAHRARLLEMVNEMSKTALEAGELGLLLQRVVRFVYARFPLLMAAIALVDEERGEFAERGYAGPMEVDADRRWPLSVGVCGRAYATGEPQLVPDVSADPDYLPGGAETVAEYAVPIVYRDRILGVLNLEAARAEVFSPENQVAFRTFADQLAGAIHLTTVNQELEAANERLRDANRRLERLSSLDALTGIANRRAFDEVLETEWRRAARAGTPLSLVIADIDCFKRFNDGYGHRRGDDTLAAVARALQESLHRAGDFVARYGGEEFVVLLPGTDGARAAAFAETLRARVEGLGIAHERSPTAPVVTASLGVASVVPAKGVAASTLIDAADRALYRAKEAGRNRVAVA